MNLPNWLSVFRSGAGFIVIYLLLAGTQSYLIAAIVVMMIAEISDMADGHIARRYGQVTKLGMIIDPMSDSLYRAMVFIGFLGIGWISVWFVAIIITRDIVVSYLRIFAQQQGYTMAARTSGKIKAIVQACAQVWTVGLYALSGFFSQYMDTIEVSFWLLAIATAVTAWSGIDYALGYIQSMRKDES
ncbi:CDP-diacylglycerol--glycerol-3-phosphate 3-phosphatidyltransferase [Kiloniella sp.]|uniref:CDP-diacylglycerol--glycerol-3-phosphate 3-phosphatidyltransferase n=1 Tax=Kiloniella sp. TaxID=1938587 RepID=UPI003B02CF31